MQRWAALFSVALLLASCSTHPPRIPSEPKPDIGEAPEEPRSKSGNPPFYEVFGQRYFVLRSSAGYLERGVASWYGPGFHGNRTASGEKYDMHAMTAAHKTLPLPCYVQVTNLGNGRSVVLRVNDRGPFHDNRLIDLSRAAAEQLDILRAGTALVQVRAVARGASAAPVAASAELYVQAGAFTQPRNAETLAVRLRAAGLEPVFVRADTINGRNWHRVRLGPVPSVAEFDRLIQALRRAGVPDARLAPD